MLFVCLLVFVGMLLFVFGVIGVMLLLMMVALVFSHPQLEAIFGHDWKPATTASLIRSRRHH